MSSPSLPAVERFPFRDSAVPMRKRIDDLLDRLTLDERIAMLHQYAPAVPRLAIAEFRTGTEALHGVAWLGVATVFPQAVGLGATWDEDLVRAVADAVSVELRGFHSVGTASLQAWAPVVNLLRDPRWGRNEEGYSEDPVHTARLAVAYCRGLAGDHPRFLRAAPVLKHFLAYNNEDDRCTTSSGLRPRVLHEYDLAAFRPAVATGAATGAMAAYNLVNGRPCHVSPLIETELRRWAAPTGHELFVVSDAEAPSNLVDVEHYFDDHAESHAAALKAGIDSFTDHGADSAVTIGRLRQALERGLIDEADVNRAVRRQLRIRFRLGEFDPDLDPYAAIGPERIDCTEHRALALRAATESVVLLRNDGLLPLDATRVSRIAVIGPLADMLCEDWYSGTMPYQVSIAAGLRDRCADVVHVTGVDRIALRSHTTGDVLCKTAFDVVDWGDGVVTLRATDMGRYLSCDDDGSLAADKDQVKTWDVREAFRLEPDPAGDPDTVLLRNVHTGRYAVVDGHRTVVTGHTPQTAERWHREVLSDGSAAARAAAATADTAVVVLGNHPLINGRETQDRTTTALPSTQEALLRAVAAVRPATTLVVVSSYPYALDWADAHLPAVVWTSHGGQETGTAVAAVLLGAAEPAGRLPQTWYRADDELPDPLNYDIIQAGWTYQYHRPAPRYPFGHGLSYTDFTYRDLRLTTTTIHQDGSLDVAVTLTNTGQRPGSDVVQLYVRALHPRYAAPQLKLADFRKVRLDPAESRELRFHLPAARFAHWDVTTSTDTIDPGAYEICVARSATDIVLTAPLTITGVPANPRSAVDSRCRAVDFDDHTGATIVDATRTTDDAITPADPTRPATLLFRATDLTGAAVFEAEVAHEDDGLGAARLEIRADDRLVANMAVPATGGRHAWTTVTTELPTPPTGVHDLRLTLHGTFRLAAFCFTSAKPA